MILENGYDCKKNYYQKIELGKAKDLSNQTFGRLKPLFRVQKNKQNIKETYWLCLCNCGNLIIVAAPKLSQNHTQSCGCIRKEQMSLLGKSSQKDLSNLIYNNFKVLKINSTFKQENNIKSKNAYWDCQCLQRGQIYIFNSGEICRNNISCSCRRGSIGENIIKQILKENNIKYLFDKPYFKDLILDKGGIGRYDFILLDENNSPYRLIEFDGRQHKENVSIFNITLEEQKRKDEIKNEYAKKHNLPLIRIPSNYKNKITIDTILKDDFLI